MKSKLISIALWILQSGPNLLLELCLCFLRELYAVATWASLKLSKPSTFAHVVSSAGKTPALALKFNLSFSAYAKSLASENGIYSSVLKT